MARIGPFVCFKVVHVPIISSYTAKTGISPLLPSFSIFVKLRIKRKFSVFELQGSDGGWKRPLLQPVCGIRSEFSHTSWNLIGIQYVDGSIASELAEKCSYFV